jgi:hypothetical protein
MNRKPPLLLTVAAVLGLLAAAPLPLHAIDPFYLDLLRDGIHAYDRNEFAAAERSLRFACFGMLDDPKALGACLARLALAQDRAADVAGFRETFTRLVEVEERFQGYSQADLPPEIRTALEQRLAVQIPAPTLQNSPPVFRAAAARRPAPAGKGQTPAKEQDRAVPQTIERRASPPASAPPSPASPASQGGQAAAAAPAGPRPLSDDEKAKLATVRKLLGETGKSKELQQAFQLAQEVAAAHPEAVEAQRLAGEAAYRASRWSDAAAYLQRGGGLPDSEPELLFYLAVSLYESGDAQGAAATLRRSLPNLQRSPYVDAYARKILAQ